MDCKYFQNKKGGLCTKTSRLNPVNGNMEHQKAMHVRFDEKQCGLIGRDYVESPVPLILPIMADFFDDFD
jgi:hypothetical protein